MTDCLQLQIQEIAGDILGIDSTTLSGTSGRDITDGWDSMQHLSIMLEIEAVSGRRFTPDELADAASIEDILTLVRGSTAASQKGFP